MNKLIFSGLTAIAIICVFHSANSHAQVIGTPVPQQGGVIITNQQPTPSAPMAGSGSINQPMQGSSSRSTPGPVTILPGEQAAQNGQAMPPQRVARTDFEWQQMLTPLQYYVTRQKGTERAFTGALLNVKDKGTFQCVCCGQALFHSSSKFESGTGWPSYNQPIDSSAIKNVVDRAHGMVRTETVCSRCDAHLGHVFQDGPAPTGLRYCMNSAALKFEKSVPPQQPRTVIQNGQIINGPVNISGVPQNPTTPPVINPPVTGQTGSGN